MDKRQPSPEPARASFNPDLCPFASTPSTTPSTPPTPAQPTPAFKRTAEQVYRKEKQKNKRQRLSEGILGYTLRAATAERFASPNTLKAEATLSTTNVTAPAWVAKPLEKGRLHSLLELLHDGFKEFDWDGLCVSTSGLAAGKLMFFVWHSTPTALVDIEERIIAILAGRPRDPDWISSVLPEANAEIEEAARALSVSDDDDRRGHFIKRHQGFAHGGGRMVSRSLRVLYYCNYAN
jgi:hypothetical protein